MYISELHACADISLEVRLRLGGGVGALTTGDVCMHVDVVDVGD